MTDLSKATLATVSDGDLEASFQSVLREVVPIFADPRPFVQDKDGRTKVKVSIEIEMIQDGEGFVSTVCRTELKRPKRKGSGGFLHRRGDQFLVSPTPVQTTLGLRAVDTKPAATGTQAE